MNVGSFIYIHKCEYIYIYIYIYILMNSDTRKHKILLVIFFLSCQFLYMKNCKYVNDHITLRQLMKLSK